MHSTKMLIDFFRNIYKVGIIVILVVLKIENKREIVISNIYF